ncbi:MAG TPA: family 43 glycosylhydrolase [Kofleriaceae bacterium]|nr:family 43 glycosylhydrolase [Kofleriaceae bacterium]
MNTAMKTEPRRHRRARTLAAAAAALLAASACADRGDSLDGGAVGSRSDGVTAVDGAAADAVVPERAAARGPSPDGARRRRTYSNPIQIRIPGSARTVENCPDPSIIRGQRPGDRAWYLYCTSNPLDDQDRDDAGDEVFHLITMHRSEDLVHWTYVGDAFSEQPDWADAPQGFWAPDIQFFDGRYHLYYSSSETRPGEPGDAVIGAAAIGVATSDSPTGPWTQAPAPVVEPQKAPCCPDRDDWRWVIDSSVVTDDSGQRWIYFGSYFGGIAVRKLSADGLVSDPASQLEIASDERYEGSYVVKRDGYYYLFVSATNCCAGPLTGYSVFVGRSASPTGPFVDREGVSFAPGRVGGTPVISMNGNRWVGTGHNAVFTDLAGQDWTVYHAIDRHDPYRGGSPLADFQVKRPALMDPLDWIDGWPTVRGGTWASDEPQPAPVARPGDHAGYHPRIEKPDRPGRLLRSLSDEFDGPGLAPQWSWVREPAADSFGVEDGLLRFDTQAADLFTDSNSASVLVEPVPAGKNYIVETAVRLVNLPADGCCFNFTQAGLVIYGDDDNFVKLVPFSLWDTRQIEFAKEEFPVPVDYPRYGNTVAGPPGETTWLRIAARVCGASEETYTAYTSLDGVTWYRAGTWTHRLGSHARIGLVSMAHPDDPQPYAGEFQYVRVYELRD